MTHKLVTRGSYPHLLAQILCLLSLTELATACLLYTTSFDGASLVELLGSGDRLKLILARFSSNPGWVRHQLPTIVLDYDSLLLLPARKFFNFVSELDYAFRRKIKFAGGSENGTFESPNCHFVDRVHFPVRRFHDGRGIGRVQCVKIAFNPVANLLAVATRDDKGFLYSVLAFGETESKRGIGKVRYFNSKCAARIAKVDFHWTANGRYLLVVEYDLHDTCRGRVLLVSRKRTISELEMSSLPEGDHQQQTPRTWFESLKGFVWTSRDQGASLKFVRVDWKKRAYAISDVDHDEDGRVCRLLTNARDLTACDSVGRLAWFNKCSAHGQVCKGSSGHDLVVLARFEAGENGRHRLSNEAVIVVSVSGLVLDLAFDWFRKSLLYAAVHDPGCNNFGTAFHARPGLQCPLRVVHDCSRFAPFHVNPECDGRELAVGEIEFLEGHRIFLQGLPPRTPFKFRYFSCQSPQNLATVRPDFRGLICSYTSEVVVIAHPDFGFMRTITIFRKTQCVAPWSTFSDPNCGPYIRHPTKPYFILKQYWRTAAAALDVQYFGGSWDFVTDAKFVQSKSGQDYYYSPRAKMKLVEC